MHTIFYMYMLTSLLHDMYKGIRIHAFLKFWRKKMRKRKYKINNKEK